MEEQIKQVIENNKKINQMIEQIIAERRKSRIPFEVNGKIDPLMEELINYETKKALEIYSIEFPGYNCQGKEGLTLIVPAKRDSDNTTADCYGGTSGLQVTYGMQDFIETSILPAIKKLGYSINEKGEAYYDSTANTEHSPNSDLKNPQKYVGSTKDQMDQFAMLFAKNGIDMDFVWDALAHEEMHTYGVTSGNIFLKEGTTEELTREICEKYGIHMSPTAHTQETEFVRKLEIVVGRDNVIASGMWTGKFKEEHFKDILEKYPKMDYRKLSEMFELLKALPEGFDMSKISEAKLKKLRDEEIEKIAEYQEKNPEVTRLLIEKVNLYRKKEKAGERYTEVAKAFDKNLKLKEGSFYKYAEILECFYGLTINHKKDPDFYRELYSMTLDELENARYNLIDVETLGESKRKIFEKDKAILKELRATIDELKKGNNLNINGYSDLMVPINQYIQENNLELEIDNSPKDYTEVLKVQEDEISKLQEIIRSQNAETVSYFHDQKSEFAMEQINSGKESLGFSDSIIPNSKSEEENYIRIHINKSKEFDFDFDIYIPKNLEEQEIERNLLVSFKEEGEREKKMAENLQSPLMTIRVAAEDKSIDVSKYAQLDPSCLVDEDGNKVAYPYGESGLDMSQQYANAIKYAYSCLKKEGLMSQEHHERADIEGYSYNAVIAQRFALLHPEMVRAVICGGAISSIPIPLTEYNGEILNYPLGIADIQKYTGKSPEQILEEYKEIIQVVYATENELRYDGNFTIYGRKIEKGDMSQEFSTTFSSHDVSPDVASVVFQQMRIFGENGDLQTDINKRINSVRELLLAMGINLRPIKIYGDMDHHSINPTTLSDMNSLITSLDEIEAKYSKNLIDGQSVLFREHSDEIKGFKPETRNGKVIEIDTSFQTKREEIYERLRNGESAKEILQSMSLEEIHKYFLGGATQKSFIKAISPRLIEEVERRQDAETVSYFHDQKSEFAMEKINSGKESLGFSDSIIPKKAETPIFSEKEIGKATVHTPLEQKQEAKSVGANDMREVEQEKQSSEKGE